MFRIYVWGAGSYARQVMDEIDDSKAKILGIIDSDKRKQGASMFYPVQVMSPSDISGKEFDYVVISVKKYETIENECNDLGIPAEKIISYWKDEQSTHLFIKRAERVSELIYKYQIYQNRLDSEPYEWNVKPTPKIQEGSRLLRKIAEDYSSLCRFGDGEFEMIRGKIRPWFQRPDDRLGRRLKEVLFSEDIRINIAIPQNFHGFEKYKENAADNIRDYMHGDTRQDILELIDKDRIYYDAYVSRPYIIYKDRKNADERVPLFQAIWKDRDVMIVEGEFSRIGIGNDLLKGAGSVSRILCPSKNAWDRYDDILDSVLRAASKKSLICISLGPCATVLAYDLARAGYQALDIGQLDNEYEWYLRGAQTQIPIPGKMVAEVSGEQAFELSDEREYISQIITRIISEE